MPLREIERRAPIPYLFPGNVVPERPMRKPILATILGAAALLPVPPACAFTNFNVVNAARAAGLQVFSDHCAACHSRAGVAKGFAPSLVGVAGRKAGSV